VLFRRPFYFHKQLAHSCARGIVRNCANTYKIRTMCPRSRVIRVADHDSSIKKCIRDALPWEKSEQLLFRQISYSFIFILREHHIYNIIYEIYYTLNSDHFFYFTLKSLRQIINRAREKANQDAIGYHSQHRVIGATKFIKIQIKQVPYRVNEGFPARAGWSPARIIYAHRPLRVVNTHARACFDSRIWGH